MSEPMFETIDRLSWQMGGADPEAHAPATETLCDILRRMWCELTALRRDMYRIQEAIEPQLKAYDAEIVKALDDFCGPGAPDDADDAT